MSLPRLLGAAALLLPALLAGGCLVDSKCHSHSDCSSDETCNMETGGCYVQCNDDKDCLVQGSYVGKHCDQRHRCDFKFDERMDAPNFCLNVVNPKSQYAGTKLCLEQLKGKVVFIFFGLMA